MQGPHRFTIRLRSSLLGCFLYNLFLQRRFVKMISYIYHILYIIKNIISWLLLKRTQHDTTNLSSLKRTQGLNCWNSACNSSKQVNLKQLPRVVFPKSQDAHRARASELLESTGTARSIRCRNWLRVEATLKTENGKRSMCVNTSLAATALTRCACARFVQSCHLRCPRWVWQPRIWWTLFHLWPAAPQHQHWIICI